MGLLLAPQNWPFSLALGLAALMGLLQVLMLATGGAAEALDVDADVDVDAGGWADSLSWLHIGRLPFSLLLMLCGLSFGLPGLFIQSVAKEYAGGYWPTGLVALLTVPLAVICLRVSGSAVRKILPHDDTEAVSVDSLIGSEAVITVGTSRRGQPAEAQVYDRYGKAQYIMVEPEHEEDVFPSGSAVLLLSREEHIFRAVGNSPRPTTQVDIATAPVSSSPKKRRGQHEVGTS